MPKTAKSIVVGTFVTLSAMCIFEFVIRPMASKKSTTGTASPTQTV
ncbi:hypothetical protein [Parvularcula sp. LCG005]|nr:hypothetical protein [Parvularcula sp. LCG005]WOI51968.1 hypothetical protein RUI03_07340 [Parvularcula sp. LCG005]